MEYRTAKRYTFRLKVGNATSVACHPLYGELVHKWTRREDEMYYEEGFDGELTFVGEDFEMIVGADISTKFELYVYRGENASEEYIKSTFMRTDGTTDMDRKTFKVKPVLGDMYKALVYGKADERNLTKLKPKQGKMSFMVSPMLQLYRPGEQYMYSVTSQGNISKREVMIESDVDRMRSVYHWWIEDNFSVYVNDTSAKGVYMSEEPIRPHASLPNTYRASLVGYKQYHVWEGVTTKGPNGYAMDIEFEVEDGASTYKISAIYIKLAEYPYTTFANYYDPGPNYREEIAPCTTKEFRLAFNHAIGQMVINVRRETIMLRPLFGKPTLTADTESSIISDDDPMFAGAQYRFTPHQRAIVKLINGDLAVTETADDGIRLVKNNENYYYSMDNFFLSRNFSVYPDAWGGLYDVNDAQFDKMAYQIGVSKTWLETLRNSNHSLNAYNKTNNDWYLLTSVIERLAHWCDSTIHFEDNREVGGVCDSLFLFGVPLGANYNVRRNVLTGDIWGRLMILQKSNILQLNYDTAATNAKITLEQVFTLLKNAFNCWYELYWWHNPVTGKDEKHLRIEHIQYYMNGHSYSNDARVVRNINEIVDVRNGKPLSYMSNNWEYDEKRCANRYAYSWMDNQSEYFDGYQMKVPEEYNIWGNSRTEERPIEWFSSDVDYLMANADQCSYEGFVVAQTAAWGSSAMNNYTYTDPSNGDNHTLQNGQLAMVYLQKKWMCYDIYSPKIRVNNEEAPYTDVVITAKLRQNTMKFRLAEGQTIRPEDAIVGMVRSGGGYAIGHVESISTDLSSDWIEATVNYDCEVPAGLTPGGSRVLPQVTTDYDDNEVMGFISRDGEQTLDVMVEQFGNNITGHLTIMESRGQVIASDDVVSVNEGQWEYTREEVLSYLRGVGDKTSEGMVANFGPAVMDYLDYLMKGGFVSVNEDTWWASYTTDELILHLANEGSATIDSLRNLFGEYVEETLTAIGVLNYCWPESDGVWKSSYLGVEFTSETEEAIYELLASTGGATAETVAMDVAEGNMKVENLLDCMVYNGILMKEEELYKLV